MNIRHVLGGAACIGFAVFSVVQGEITVGHHDGIASRMENPMLFWVLDIALIVGGIWYLSAGLRNNASN